jgi:hypothetical protein
VKVRSTTETFGVGTRIEEPSSLPLSSGSTSPTARAAPVVVGIMDIAAARARRGSSVDLVEDLLVVGVGVDRGHQPALDADRIVEHLGHGREAVGGARRVGDDLVIGGQLVVVDAIDDGQVDALAGAEIRTRLAPASRCFWPPFGW